MRKIYSILFIVLLTMIGGVASAQQTWYTLASGNWDDPDIWTLDPAGAIAVGSAVPSAGDNVVIKTGKVITVRVTDPVTVLNLETVTIEGSLKLGSTSGHSIATLKGSGKIFIQGNNFPSVTDASHFVSEGKGEGTVVFEGNSFSYGTGITDTFYNLEVNTNAGQTVTLLNNLNLNGNLLILQGTLQINDGSSTTALTLNVTKNITVQANGGMTVGTANAIHRINASGDLKNYGSVDFSNSAQYAAASSGAVNVNFTGNSDNDLVCNGTTTFYRLFLNKGTDRTYTLAVNANNVANFNLYGPISGSDGIEGSDGPAGWERLALVLNSGTLKLESNINIPQLGALRDGTGPNEFHIPSAAQLWINGATVATHTSGGSWRGITIYGKLKVSSGSFTNPSGTGGITYFSNPDSPGTLEITGGDVYTTQLKQDNASGKFNYIQSGGNLHINALSDGRGVSAIFALPGTDDYFEMSGGKIIIDAVNTAGTNGIEIGSSLGNYNVTGGTIEIQTPTLDAATENQFEINSAAPFYNLSIVQSVHGGSQTVVLQGGLTVINDVSIAAGTTINAAGFDLEIGGNFANSGTYTSGANTTVFSGTNNSTVTGNITFNNLQLNKDATSATLTLGAGAIGVTGNLTITKGTFDVGSSDRNLGGNIDISYGTITGASALVLNSSSAQQTLKGKVGQNPSFGNLKLNNTFSTAPQVKLLSDADATTVEFQQNLIFDLDIYNLDIENADYTSGSWGSNRMYTTAGIAANGGLTLSITLNTTVDTYNELVQFFPIGTSSGYTPVSIYTADTKTDSGSITIVPVNDYHPTSTDWSGAESLAYYWKSSYTGLSSVVEDDIRYMFTYHSSLPTLLGSWRGWVMQNNLWTDYNGIESGTSLDFNFGTLLTSDYTYGRNNPFNSVETFYSRAAAQTSGSAQYDDKNSWTTSPDHDGKAAGRVPQWYDMVVIGGDATNGNHTIIVDNGAWGWPNDNRDRASQVYIKGKSETGIATGNPPTLDVTEAGNNTNLQFIRGNGRVYSDGSLPNADFSEFCGSAEAIFEYGTGTYTLPVTSNIPYYPNLHFTGSGEKFGGDEDILVNGNLFVDDATFNISNNASGDVTVFGDVLINTGTLSLPANQARIVDIDGNITISGTGVLNVAAGTTVDHQINLEGSISQGTGSIQLAETGGAIISFEGTQSATFSKNSGISEFYKLNVNKPVGEKVTFLNGFSLPANAAGVSKNLILSSGECHLQNTGININLSTGGSDFQIPSGTILNVDGATVNVGGTGATGIWLDGSLIVNNNGAVYCHKGSGAGNTDNYIEYTSSGDASIWLGSGAKLKVGSQIRRSLNTDVGILSFTQSVATDTVAVGLNEAGNTSRGLFEVLGAGSSFTQAANAEITIVRGHGAGYRSLWFEPETVSLASGSGFVIGDDTHTPASQEIGIYAAQPINNLSINATNTPKVTLMVMPLNLQESLIIGAGAELDAAGLDIILKGNFTNAGTYTANNNTIYFDGTNDQTISGTTTFYNLVKQTTANTLNLASTIEVSNNLSLLSGTLSTDVNNLNVQGNVINNSITTSLTPGLGIVMNNTTTQQELSGTGVFGRLCIDNSRGVVMPTQSTAISITDLLTLEDGVFDIGRNLMELSSAASFSPGTTHGGYTSNNMVQTNLSFSDAGIRKDFPTTVGGSFIYPIGSFGKYTPVSFANLNYADGTGSIRVKAANEAHLSVLDISNVLQYNWTLDAQGINGFTADVAMECDPTDIALNGHLVTEYVTAQYLLQPNDTVYKFSVDDFVEPNTLTYQFALATDTDIDGDYSAGIPSAIPDKVPSFITVAAGDWQTQNNWATYDPATSAIGAAGAGVPVLGPRGSNVYIAHEITLSGNGDAAAYGTILQSNGKLITGSTFAHRLGEVSGSGTLVLESGDMPAGVYDQFFSTSGGTLEFTGTAKSYDILSEITQINNLIISGSGTRNFPNLDVQLLGDWMMSGPNVDNEYNKVLSVQGDITFNGGTYNPRNGSIVLNGSTSQVIDGTIDFTASGGGSLYDLTINNTTSAALLNNIEVSNALTLSNGVISTKSGGSLTITNSLPAAVVGGSNSSYVEGPLSKALGNNSTFVFPVGDATRYSPITVSPDISSGGIWTVQYYNNNPGADGFDPTSMTGEVAYVSRNEYWRVAAPAAGNASLTLEWDSQSGVNPADSDFRVVRWTDMNPAADAWAQQAINTPTGNASSGTVSTSTDISFNDFGTPGWEGNYLTFGSISIPSYDWLGGTSNWFTPGNWGDGTVPTAGTDITIPSGVTAPVIDNSALAQVNNLTISSGTTLTLQPGAQMTINGNLVTNNDNLVIDNTNALPVSLITHGSVTDATDNTTGNVQVKWTYDAQRYWYIGHAVSNPGIASYEQLVTDGNVYHLYDYPAGSWNNITGIGDGFSERLKGYALKVDNNINNTVTHSGLLTTGVVYSSTLVDGWQLIANPYQAYYQLPKQDAAGADFEYTTGSAYVRTGADANNRSFATYNTLNGISTPEDFNGVIAPGQCFWVKKDPLALGTDVFMQSINRIHDTNRSSLKSLKSNDVDLLRIKVMNDFAEDEAVVAFRHNGLEAFSRMDAEQRMVSGTKVSYIYSLKSNKNAVINVQPMGMSDLIIPLGIKAQKGNHTLSIKGIDYLSQAYSVFIEDKELATITPLTEGQTYAFTSEAGVNNSRFVLHLNFVATNIGDLDDKSNESEVLVTIKNKNSLFVNCNWNSEFKTVQLYNLKGTKVLEELMKGDEYSKELNLQTGIYLVRVSDSNNNYQTKVFVK